MKTATVLAFVWSLGLAGPGLSQSLEAIAQPQLGRSMRASSGNPVDNADSAKFAIGETKTLAHSTPYRSPQERVIEDHLDTRSWRGSIGICT